MLGLCLILGLCALTGCSSGSAPRMIGAAEDAGRQQDLALASAQMAEARRVDFNTIRLTQTWTTGERAVGPADRAALGNAIEAARAAGIRIVLSIYPFGSSVSPLNEEARADFASFASDIAQRFPYLHDFIVGNEPNINRFWQPQFGPAGEDAAAPAYEQLLAATYDALKRIRPHATVYGGALAPRGSDRPNTGRDTHSPTTFIRDLGAAYKESGRTIPIMDAFAFHPYPDTPAAGAGIAHPHSTSIGLADYATLVGLLVDAFAGTRTDGSTLPILYDEFGVETTVPAAKEAAYTGAEPATTHPVSSSTQAEIYARALEAAVCQKNVVGILLFHVQDEPALSGWQSGEFYADGSAKASLSPVATAVRNVEHRPAAACRPR